MKKYVRMTAALAVALMLGGCMSSLMTKTPGAAPSPEPGKALVIFMRPSSFGGAIQSSVYDTGKQGDDFIGVVSAKTKLAYQADPGTHLFMVVAENGDFMNATLDAGKTYYVLVSPRVGVFKARFSLLPIHNDPAAKYSLQSQRFQSWKSETSFVVKTPAADQWYAEHKASVNAKQAEYMQKWNRASAQQKAELTLHAADGI
ncbi:hypothetical protein GCM10027285_07250 [Oleiagrimonas citrea]|uniref:DUF2846 domain-containing protein n=1 Tax=Oleiagrimonas citrea TaxID=1665687 RepID=A0A846ZL10_9GAMM|nr:hypothetical protein [Oleiagrimonas citrea]NKZ38706.1 hypothetical protein [Oleiagrimonas citrea]